jgi:hypothetical protein
MQGDEVGFLYAFAGRREADERLEESLRQLCAFAFFRVGGVGEFSYRGLRGAFYEVFHGQDPGAISIVRY